MKETTLEKMVTDKVLIRDKWASTKKVLLIVGIVLLVIIVLSGMFIFGFFAGKKEIILTNPIEGIVAENTDEAGQVNTEAVVEQGILEFNENYINYILVALGVGYLHKSLTFENPFIEFVLGDEVWGSEIKGGSPNSALGSVDNEDLRISISKEEAVKALISDDIEQFMKDSVSSGNTKIEMIAGKTELFTKGYLKMYSELTGEELE